MTEDQIDIISRALALRRMRKIAALYAEGNSIWISHDEYEPWKRRVRISFEALKTLVEEIESTLKRSPQSEKSNVRFDRKIHVDLKNTLAG